MLSDNREFVLPASAVTFEAPHEVCRCGATLFEHRNAHLFAKPRACKKFRFGRFSTSAEVERFNDWMRNVEVKLLAERL